MDSNDQALLNVLKREQEKHGYLTEHVLKQISIEREVPISKLYGIATFYSMLRTEEVGENMIEICMSTSCFLNNSKTLKQCLEEEIGVETGETSDDGISLFRVSCIGCCDEAPAMLVNGEPYTKLTEERVGKIVEELKK